MSIFVLVCGIHIFRQNAANRHQWRDNLRPSEGLAQLKCIRRRDEQLRNVLENHEKHVLLSFRTRIPFIHRQVFDSRLVGVAINFRSNVLIEELTATA
jgi:hypothetical protein